MENLTDREISWLAFNQRVLELAEDKNIPLLERVRFLTIFSSNLDEFYMVRVASVLRKIENNITSKNSAGYTPHELLAEISRIVKDLIAGSAGLETIAGARGGAGALAIDTISGLFGGGRGKSGGLAGAAAATFGIGLAGEAAMRTDPTGLGGFGAPAIGSTSGQTFNGGITINVSAPPSSDPAAFASSISQIFSGLT
jgi:hypothetical protein